MEFVGESYSTRIKMAGLSIIALLTMAYIDYITGTDLIFSASYLMPVALCAWYLNRRAVWAMSLASGVASWFVDEVSDHVYSRPSIQIWNAFLCFLVCITTGLILLRLKHTLEERTRINRDLQKALEDLKESTDEIRKLQNGLQLVCAWTHRIKVGEEWMTPEDFLVKQLHLKLSHGMSPEAASEWDTEAAVDVNGKGISVSPDGTGVRK